MKLVHHAMGLGIVMACASLAGPARAQSCYIDQQGSGCTYSNLIGSSTTGVTLIGGQNNQDYSNFSTISGGQSNEILSSADYATVGGGVYNVVGGSNGYAIIGGGYNNYIEAFSAGATICGGYSNNIFGGQSSGSSATGSTIGGGYENQVGNALTTYSYQTIGGGYENLAETNFTTVCGGANNSAEQDYASILGGHNNTASGGYSSVLGGIGNTASGTASVAAGYYADADANGCFVFADTSSTSVQTCTVGSTSNQANAFVVRATGGVEFVTAFSGGAPTGGVYLGSGGNTWNHVSDRNAKNGFQDVDTRAVLMRVAAMPITTWKYNTEVSGARHMGPMAQDLYAAFELGDDDRHVTSIDEAGVAFAAIQGLYAEVLQRDEAIDALRTREASLESANTEANRKVASLEQRLAAIEAHLGLTK